jgi:hypothetical protein
MEEVSDDEDKIIGVRQAHHLSNWLHRHDALFQIGKMQQSTINL